MRRQGAFRPFLLELYEDRPRPKALRVKQATGRTKESVRTSRSGAAPAVGG